MRVSTPVSFENAQGLKLSGILDTPKNAPPRFYAVFAPCFTCTKDAHAAAKVSRALAERGGGVLRFDIAGLGQSAGDFAYGNFSTRVDDIVAACRFVAENYAPPAVLVGHSISGTAALSAARRVEGLQVVATIGAPCDPAWVIESFEKRGGIVMEDGDMARVVMMGQVMRFHKGFIADMRGQPTARDTAEMTQKLFVFHAPEDDIVGFHHAEEIFRRAQAGGVDATLLPLAAGATHLFENRKDDAEYVAETLAALF